MKPRGKAGQARGRRISAARVERWFPGRGSAFIAPPARVFYATKLRASLHWWKREKAEFLESEIMRAGLALLLCCSYQNRKSEIGNLRSLFLG